MGFDDALLDWLVLPNFGTIYLRYAYFQYKNERTGTTDAHPVYCIDPTKGGAYEIVAAIGPNTDGSNTATYIRGERVGDARYKGIMVAGYPHQKFESFGLQSREEGYYATKLALWMYVRGNNPDKLTINPKYGNSDPVALRVRAAAIDKAAKGYMIDTAPHNIEVKNGSTATLTVTNRKTSGIIIHKIDSVTKKGIYGVTFLLYNEYNTPIGQYESDQDGFVYLGSGLTDGKYKIRELTPASGYAPDNIVRTIYLEYGRTTEIEWENVALKGQIIVTKRSAQYNEVTGLPAGSPLSGAVFEVYSTAGNIVDRMVSDAKGVAASKPIPLGVYFVKEVSPPKYYALNTREFFAELKHSGDIVRFECLDENISLGVTIQKKSQNQATPGQTIYYDLFNIANTSSSALESFYVHDRLPTDAVRGTKVFTGTWSDRLTYRVTYKTNYSSEYRALASGLSTKTNYELSIHPNVLGLANGEYVTDVRWEFGTVPSGFKSVENPKLMVQVLPTLPKDYKIVNRADVGGLYIGEWETAQTSWTIIVIGGYNPPALPKTGY